MSIIAKVITANEAVKISSQFVDIEHEYVINFVLLDIEKYASGGKNSFYYSKQWVNDWFWEDVTSYYCFNYFRRLGYQISVEANRYKENDQICMIRW